MFITEEYLREGLFGKFKEAKKFHNIFKKITIAHTKNYYNKERKIALRELEPVADQDPWVRKIVYDAYLDTSSNFVLGAYEGILMETVQRFNDGDTRYEPYSLSILARSINTGENPTNVFKRPSNPRHILNKPPLVQRALKRTEKICLIEERKYHQEILRMWNRLNTQI